jgi:hypothetical protein
MNPEPSPAGPTTIPEATVEVGQKYLSNNGKGPMLAEILAVEGEAVRYQWHNITATKRPQFRTNAAPIRYFTQYGWVLQTGPPPAPAKSKDAQIAELRSELARERRRTASLVMAGNAFLAMDRGQPCMCGTKAALGEAVLCQMHKMIQDWEQAKDALAGPGGEETAE